MIHTCVAKTI